MIHGIYIDIVLVCFVTGLSKLHYLLEILLYGAKTHRKPTS